ncbi:helix-turn-helix transcriptional regulator [Corynebacterium ammoniagenes]|uniref:helix-turn-helix transcriptional regulator n=1 Tax=Corynebacterium ammoniagenes TaxID=1697 RepID=UPI00145960D4|nr:helix-turn-helix transcriptional regulator [Corynebacterium ammoniagenes]NMF32290.1 helix-turn-helix transcriptional regulator [Corynebacterium ammoniagenes]
MQSQKDMDSDFINQAFGKRVSHFRENELGITQSQLAELLGEKLGKPVNTSTINRIEKGTRPTPVNEVFALAQIFHQRPQDLLPSASLKDELLIPAHTGINHSRRIIARTQERLAGYEENLTRFNAAKDAALTIAETVAGERRPTIKALKDALSTYARFIQTELSPFSSIRDLEPYFELPESRIQMIDKYQERNTTDLMNTEYGIANMLGDGLGQKYGLSNAES